MFNLPFELPYSWELKTVGQLIEEGIIEKPLDGNHGGTHPKSSDYIENGVPFIMASDLDGGRVSFNSCKFISEKQAKTLRKGFSKSGDVLISHKATIGRTAIVQESEFDFIMLTPQVTYYRVINNSKLNNVYLKAYFDSRFFQTILGLWAGAGSTRAYLGITSQLKLPIIVPPIDSQISVANHVGMINDKIELNRQINQTLEQMAQAIFKSWFVDFDPVRAKMEGRDTGLPTEIAELFPNELEESELGLVPKGWGVKPLDQIADYLNGLAMQKFPVENGTETLPVIKIAQLKKGDTVGADIASSKIKSEYVVDDGDVLFSWSGSLEVDIWCGGQGALNQHLFKVTSKEYPKWFYYYWTKHHLEKFQAIAAGKAVTMGHIQRKHLTEARCYVPDKRLFENINSHISNLVDEQINLRLQSRKLSELRDSLLPKLLSGEIEINSEMQKEVA